MFRQEPVHKRKVKGYMKKKSKSLFFIGVGLLMAFVIWTVSVRFVDVRAIGPNDSSVGFALLNGYVHNLTGVNFTLYVITDWLGLVPIGVAFGFAVIGLVQLIKRKSLFKVDKSILLLGGFYIVVMAVFFFATKKHPYKNYECNKNYPSIQ